MLRTGCVHVLCRMFLSRRYAALVLICVQLLSTLQVRELLKFPILIEHYFDHQLEERHQSVFSYLTQHYLTEDGTDADANEDRMLPFGSKEEIALSSFVVMLMAPVCCFHLPDGIQYADQVPVLDVDRIPTRSKDELLRPPIADHQFMRPYLSNIQTT